MIAIETFPEKSLEFLPARLSETKKDFTCKALARYFFKRKLIKFWSYSIYNLLRSKLEYKEDRRHHCRKMGGQFPYPYHHRLSTPITPILYSYHSTDGTLVGTTTNHKGTMLQKSLICARDFGNTGQSHSLTNNTRSSPPSRHYRTTPTHATLHIATRYQMDNTGKKIG